MSGNDTPLAGDAILVVDDNAATRYATVRVLRSAGLRTREAATATQALSMADEQVAVIVLDIHLPDANGFEVCSELRARQSTARIPIIHLSAAYVTDDDKVRGLDGGADGYLTHPVEPAVLVAQVRAMMRTRAAEDAMRRSENKFRAIFDLAPSGICLVDDTGHFREANPAMLALFERGADEVLGKAISDFAPEAMRELVARDVQVAIEAGQWRGEFALENAQQQPIFIEWSFSDHSEPGLRMAVAMSISERYKLARQREDLLEREQAARAAAEHANRTKDDFLAVLSHELRTPLNAIVGWTHVLRLREDSPERLKGLDAITRNAHVQTRLISDLLDVSRINLGKLRLNLETMDPAVVVSDAVHTLRPLAADKGIILEEDLDTDGVQIEVDPSRLQQIVWNLLTNAIKFSVKGDVVRVSLSPFRHGVRLRIQDQGQGIKPDFLPHLFDRFSQGDSASNRHHGGLGLGLSIVSHLVELHKGSVTASSEGPGKGSLFTVFLPGDLGSRITQVGDLEGDLHTETTHLEQQDELSLKGLRVLVVDDDEDACQVLRVILSDRHAEVSVANSCAQALAAREVFQPDILISDIGMPGEDGLTLIRTIRQREKPGRPGLPAIALTAFTRPQDEAMALAAGFNAYLHKPVHAHDLVAGLLALMASHALA
ncbi:MAG: response regulator [Rubrivivax sp.]|nr:MAG: response regulator [Rubrivivax sp.]